jgi:rhodanese-related sulfurtransferase
MVSSHDRAPLVVELAPLVLRERMNSAETLTLLDVREPQERSLCTIAVPPSARELFIPMREIPTQLDVLTEAIRRGPLVVYCHHGVRSRAVAEWLAGRGLGGIINLTGGIDAWSREADPTVPRYS